MSTINNNIIATNASSTHINIDWNELSNNYNSFSNTNYKIYGQVTYYKNKHSITFSVNLNINDINNSKIFTGVQSYTMNYTNNILKYSTWKTCNTFVDHNTLSMYNYRFYNFIPKYILPLVEHSLD